LYTKVFTAFVLHSLRLFKLKPEGQTVYRKPHCKDTKLKCVVPENIHTPTMEELEIPEGLGGGGSKTQEIPEGRRVEWSL